MNKYLRHPTVKLIGKLLKPLVDENVIYWEEYTCIISNLKHFAEKDRLPLDIKPSLLTIDEAAKLMRIAKSQFKKLEKDGRLPFKRKMLGTSVRYRSHDLYQFVLSHDDIPPKDQEL